MNLRELRGMELAGGPLKPNISCLDISRRSSTFSHSSQRTA
jgi:hypothetical protein